MSLTTLVILRLAAALAYLSRPWSCGMVLGSIPLEGNPYSRFDYHGFGLMLVWASTLLLSPLAWFIVREGTKRPVALRQVDGSSAGVALLVLLFLGSPALGQLTYLTDLPLALSWPVVTSSTLWFVIVAYLSFAAFMQKGQPS